jgi:hypothetical protein
VRCGVRDDGEGGQVMNLTHDKEFQKQLLNHPAYRHQGVDPLWRIIAIMGWATVLALMVALSARSQDLVVGLNEQRALTPLARVLPSPFGMAEPERMTLPALGTDNQKISPSPASILLNASACDCRTVVAQTGSGRNF